MLKKYKYFLLLILLILVGSSFIQLQDQTLNNETFDLGESYDYKVKFGFITIGGADVDVDKKLYLINGKPCYKVNVLGKTAGITDLYKVRNTYRSFIDTAEFLPHRFIYSARENNFKRDQTVNFNQDRHIATQTEDDASKSFNVPSNIHDVISGYYFLRTINYNGLNVGQSITAPVFFDNEHFQMKVKYLGKDRVKTRYGRIKVLKLTPILPKNDLFSGEEAIKIWVSDDKNRVPIRIEANFKIGSISMELHKYQGVKYPFSWI